GVRVAVGDVVGQDGRAGADGRADIVTGPGPGAGPLVRVFSGLSGAAVQQFFAFDPGFTGGASGAAGAYQAQGLQGHGDILVGPGAGQAPEVKVFQADTPTPLQEFRAYLPVLAAPAPPSSPANRPGVSGVAFGGLNANGVLDILVGVA